MPNKVVIPWHYLPTKILNSRYYIFIEIKNILYIFRQPGIIINFIGVQGHVYLPGN